MPAIDKLPYTSNDEADRLLVQEPLQLLNFVILFGNNFVRNADRPLNGSAVLAIVMIVFIVVLFETCQ